MKITYMGVGNRSGRQHLSIGVECKSYVLFSLFLEDLEKKGYITKWCKGHKEDNYLLDIQPKITKLEASVMHQSIASSASEARKEYTILNKDLKDIEHEFMRLKWPLEY